MVSVFRVRMDDGAVARTDGKDIWVDDRLDAVGLRSNIMHELVHIEWGHTSHQREAVEMAVRYETARRLLPLESIVGVCKESLTLKSLARVLEVTPRVLMDRAATLTDAEAKAAGCLECLMCPAIKARYGRLKRAA